ncbi:MAG: DUF4012 domain-containing protein [Chloroflexi bacterium]|nr:DUF4012 domain-containing protein [Chloroflexota bacterium]
MAETISISSRRLWARRGFFFLLALFIALLLLWGWRTYRHAAALRAHLRELATLRVENLDRVSPYLALLQDDLVRLRRDLAIPLALAPKLSWVPRFGPTLQAAPTLLSAAELALPALSTMWSAVEEPAIAIVREGDLAGLLALGRAIAAHEAELGKAAAEMNKALDLVDSLAVERLDPRLAEPLLALEQATPLLRAGLQSLPLWPGLLEGEKTWLLLALNQDELRATGGFISSIGTLTLGPSPELGPLQDSYKIENWDKAHPDPPEALRRYMAIDLWVTRDGNWWPDFAASAQAVADLYRLNQDVTINGVVAVDMLGAARILEALAPLTLSDGTRLERDQVLQNLRESWGLREEELITPGVVITATRPYSAIEVELILRDKTGQVWFDEVELESLAAPGDNLVVNGSFEEDADHDRIPDGWEPTGLTSSDGLAGDVAYTGQRSFTFIGQREQDKRLKQRLEVSGRAGDVYRANALSKADGVEIKGGPYALRVTFLGAKGERDSHRALFPDFNHDWASAGTASKVAAWWRGRKAFVTEIVAAAGQKLLQSSRAEWLSLLKAFYNALAERHIQLYSRDVELQTFFQQQGWAGTLARGAGDYLLVVDSNVGYNKLNASIEQRLDYQVALDAQGGPRGRLSIRYRNPSRASVDECDKFRTYAPFYKQLVEGCYWDYVRVYVPAGAELFAGEGGDEPFRLVTDERGAESKAVWATSLLLRPGEERELLLEYRLPISVTQGTHYLLTVQKQAGTDAIPLRVTVTGPHLAPSEAGEAPTTVASDRLIYETDLRLDRRISVLTE